MTEGLAQFLVGIVYLAIIYMLVRPGSKGPKLVNQVSDALTLLVKVATIG